MKYLTVLILMASCSPQAVKMIDDIVEGEERVFNQVAADEISVPAPSPTIPVPAKS